MKKLLFIPVAFALVASVATCTHNLSATASTVVPKSSSSPTPTTQSLAQATFAALTSDWYQYKATDGSYSASFPGQPTESVESDSSVQVIYEDRVNNRVYMTQSTPLSPKPSQLDAQTEKALVQGALDAGVASLTEDGSTITDLQHISFNGLSGREVTVRSKQGMVMKMRMFIDPKVPAMYMAAVGAENGSLDFPETQAFLDSVSIPQK
jgi:hypothetical protein